MADAKPLEKNVKLGVIALVAVALVILLPVLVSQTYILLLIPLLMIGLGAWRLYQGKSGLLLLILGILVFLMGGNSLLQLGEKITTRLEQVIDGRSAGTSRPVVGSNGIVTLRKGEIESFLVDGPVAIRNYAGYCIEVSPREDFKMDATDDARIVYIEPRNHGETVLATVAVKPAQYCGHRYAF
jgi:hypothetical protein